MIVKFTEGKKDQWYEYLSTCVFAYNTARHVSTCHSPFEIMFGRKANLPTDIDSETSDGDQLLQELQSSVPSELNIKIWLLFSGFVSSCKIFCMEVQPEYSHFCKINVALVSAILFAK